MADLMQTHLTLQDAYGRAKHALESGAPERAIAIAQHILRYYPRYLDAYRLLGEAYLERGHIDDAHRLFSHVLQGDPQNVLARIGRGIVADERGDTDGALDEYERAFEIDPSIPELRSELLRLYTGRYGSAGATIRTTPSGLAYMHLRAGLRDAAISEFSHVAQQRPDRWDLEVALTEALWRNEQFDEAAAISGDLLASHPSCVKCHWILGYLHWSNGRTESGRQYLLDAVALDPTYSIAERLWEATPWPIDPKLTRRQPALIPAWSGDALEATDLDLGLSLRTHELEPNASPSATVDGGRSTQKFRVMPALPQAEPGLAGTVDPGLAIETPLLPVDLDWFDDWASAAETAIPAPGSGPEIAPLPAAAPDAGPVPVEILGAAVPAVENAAVESATAVAPVLPQAAPDVAEPPLDAPPAETSLPELGVTVDEVSPASAEAFTEPIPPEETGATAPVPTMDTAPVEEIADAPAEADSRPAPAEAATDLAPAEEIALAPAGADAGPPATVAPLETAPAEEMMPAVALAEAEPGAAAEPQRGSAPEGGVVADFDMALEEPALPIEDVDTDAFLRWLTGQSQEPRSERAGAEGVPLDAMDEDRFVAWLAGSTHAVAQEPADPADPAAQIAMTVLPETDPPTKPGTIDESRDGASAEPMPADEGATAGEGAPAWLFDGEHVAAPGNLDRPPDGDEGGLYRQISQSRL